MNGQQWNEELLSAYVDGECTTAERATVEARVAESPELRIVLEEIEAARAAVRALPTVDAPPEFWARLLDGTGLDAAAIVAVGGAPTTDAAPVIELESKRRMSRTTRWVAAAGGAAAAAVIAVVVLVPQPRQVDPPVASFTVAHNVRSSLDTDAVSSSRRSQSKPDSADDALGRVLMRLARLAGAVLALVAMLAVAFVSLADAHADDAEAVLERARTATVREDFSGVIEIEWISNGRWETARVPVNGTGGTVQVGEGTRKAAGRDDERWIAGVSGWQAGWDEPVSGAVPAPSKHWKLTVAKGPEIAGRTTDVVTARDRDTRDVRLKVYTDRATGVMLRREVLDRKGQPVRAVGFVDVKKLGGARSSPPAQPKAKNRAPDKVADLPDDYVAPGKVAREYALAGRYLRDDGVVQLFYSDGLFGVSLFEQRGDLDWDGLPRGGGDVDIDGTDGRGYEVAGGTVLVWEHGGLTFTVVSDATMNDLQAFAASFDARHADDDGIVEDVADFVLGPFGWK